MSEYTLAVNIEANGRENIADLSDTLDGLGEKIHSISDQLLSSGESGGHASEGMDKASAGAKALSLGAEEGSRGVRVFKEGLSELSNELSSTVTGFGRASALLRGGGIGALLGLGFLGGEELTTLNNLAATLDLPIEKAHELSLAFQDAGVGANSLSRAGLVLANVVNQGTDALDKGTATSARYNTLTDKLGISIYAANGAMRSQGDILTDTLNQLGGMANATDRNRMAVELFGSRFANQLLPALSNWNSLSAEARKQAAVMGDGLDNAAARAQEFNTDITTLKTDVEALAIKALPILTTALEAIDKPLSIITKVASTHALLGAGIGAFFGPEGAAAGFAIGMLADKVGVFGHNSNDATEKAKELAGGINSVEGAAGNASNIVALFNQDLNDMTAAADKINKPLADFSKDIDKLKNVPTLEIANLNGELAQEASTVARLQMAYDGQAASDRAAKEAIDDQVMAIDKKIEKLTEEEYQINKVYDAQNLQYDRTKSEEDYQSQRRDLTDRLNAGGPDYGGTPKSAQEVKAHANTLRELDRLDKDHAHQQQLNREQDQKTAEAARSHDLEQTKKGLDDKKKDIDQSLLHGFGDQLQDAKDVEQQLSGQLSVINKNRDAQVEVTKQLEAQKLAADGTLEDEKSILDDIRNFLAAGQRTPPSKFQQPSFNPGEAPEEHPDFAQQAGNQSGKDSREWLVKLGGAAKALQDAAAAGLDTSYYTGVPLPKRASGGPVDANHPYMVGEEGAEMFIPNSSGRIVSNYNMQRSQKQLQVFGGVTINMASGGRSNDALNYLLARI